LAVFFLYATILVITNVLTGGFMGTINIRVDDDLKARAFEALETLGVSPSELLRQTLEYVAINQKLPFKTLLVSQEDEDLIALVNKRLQSPQPVKVSLDDL
jgi:RHH-type rel operon transcriptional repressor/antitoxin RelB